MTRRHRFLLAAAAVILFLSSTALLLHTTSSSSSLFNYYSRDYNYLYDTTTATAANRNHEDEQLDYLLGLGAPPLPPLTTVIKEDAHDNADNQDEEKNGQSSTIIMMNNATIGDTTNKSGVRRRKKQRKEQNDNSNPYSNRGAIMKVLKSKLDPNIIDANLINTTTTMDDDDDDDDDDKIYIQYRPRKDPKGVQWLGWSTTTKDKNDDSTKKNGRNRQQQRKDSRYWWRQSQYCFEIDNVCHRKKENEWFYYPPPFSTTPSSSSFQTQQQEVLLLQPNMELKSAPHKYDGHTDIGDVRISIKLLSSSPISKSNDIQFHYNEEDGEVVSFSITNKEQQQNNGGDSEETKEKKKKKKGKEKKCYISSTPTHIVLQSIFNDMIGEFYTRTLLGVYNMMKNAATDIATTTTTDDDNDVQLLPWEEDIQFYIHLAYGNKNMLDGHVLLLNGILSNNITTTPLSFLDLFVNTKNNDYDEGDEGDNNDNISNDDDDDDDDDCQCYQKMVFCGYDVYMHDNNIQSKDIEPQEEKGESIEDSNVVHTITNYDPATKYTLWSSSSTYQVDKPTYCKSIVTGKEYECLDWYYLRSHLAANFISNYPTLSQDVSNIRREYLLQVGRITTSYQGDTKEYTIIGLTQRTYRRAWLNLLTIVDKCNTLNDDDKTITTTPNLKDDRRRNSVICVEINVETTKSPYEQLVVHQSLDGIIGIHGAQLTQAILLPKHGHVLELLPWIPPYIRGGWTAWTHVPTPLGIIFHNTDINHVGLSLNRESVPLCEGVATEEEEACFLQDRKKFMWDNRDFTVNADAILMYIEKFVLLYNTREMLNNSSQTCDELRTTLDDRFVMYNVWCTRSSSLSPQTGNNNSTVSAVWHNYHDKPK